MKEAGRIFCATPAAMRLPGFQFHDKQDSMPYGWRGSRTNRDAYVQELWRLQTALMQAAAGIARQCRAPGQSRRRPRTAAPRPGRGASICMRVPKRAAVCDEVRRALSQDGIAPLSAVADPGRDIADWMRESRARMETAKRCDALALVRADGDERFIDDLLEIGVDERERIRPRAAPRCRAPCSTARANACRSTCPSFGIERFDIASDDWRGKFHGWLDQTRGRSATAP